MFVVLLLGPGKLRPVGVVVESAASEVLLDPVDVLVEGLCLGGVVLGVLGEGLVGGVAGRCR